MVFNREKKESLFRQESLERLSSPERLDQLMKVVSPADWLTLSAFCGLIAMGLVWSILGRIPITVEGRGIFIQPRRVIDFQSNISGQLKSLNIKGGQCVQKDDVLATVDPIDLREQLQLSRGKLTQLQAQAENSSALSSQRMELERSAIAASRMSLVQRLQDSRTLTPILQVKGLDAIQGQRRSLQQRLQDSQTLVPVMQARLEERRILQAQGAIPKDSMLQVEQEYTQARQSVAEIEAQLQELDVKSTETDRQYLENLRASSDLQAQLQELDTQGKRLDQENLETTTQRTKEIQEVSREVAHLEQQITHSSRIVSAQAGCILEVNTAVGQVVQTGANLGKMQIAGQGNAMMGISYFAIKDGKQVKPGMAIAITPDTVQRERFGGIQGKVTEVSALPVTKEGVLSVIGNAEVVQTLLAQGAVVEIAAYLEADAKTMSGYRWSSSKGPDAKITPGTTASVRVTIEERAPITFLLPFLQALGGFK